MKKFAFVILLILASICFGVADANLVSHWKFETLTYAVSGTLNPNVTGAYIVDGTFDGHICYKKSSPIMYRGQLTYFYVLWWHYWDEILEIWIDYWAVSCARNTNTSNVQWYKLATSSIFGNYTLTQNSATGTLYFSPVTISEEGYTGSYLSSEPNVFGSLITGKIGNALNFDSTKNNYVDTLDVNSTLQKDFSISLWFKAADGRPGNDENLFGALEGGPTQVIILWLSSNGILSFRYYPYVDGGAITTPVLFADGQQTWHHVVCVVKQTSDVNITSYIYFDGACSTSQESAGVMSTYQNSRNLLVGNCVDGTSPIPTEYFNGVIDDFRIYDKALTSFDVRQLWKQGMGLSLAVKWLGEW